MPWNGNQLRHIRLCMTSIGLHLLCEYFSVSSSSCSFSALNPQFIGNLPRNDGTEQLYVNGMIIDSSRATHGLRKYLSTVHIGQSITAKCACLRNPHVSEDIRSVEWVNLNERRSNILILFVYSFIYLFSTYSPWRFYGKPSSYYKNSPPHHVTEHRFWAIWFLWCVVNFYGLARYYRQHQLCSFHGSYMSGT